MIDISQQILNILKSSSEVIDVLIGVGMEGNILGGYLNQYTDIPFTFTPVINKKEFNFFEREISFKEELYKTVVFVLDVINTGITIQKIIESFKGMLKNVEKILIVSIFYTGENYNIDLFKEKIDERIDFLTLCDEIKTTNCIKKDKKECFIYMNKLDKVHEFY